MNKSNTSNWTRGRLAGLFRRLLTARAKLLAIATALLILTLGAAHAQDLSAPLPTPAGIQAEALPAALSQPVQLNPSPDNTPSGNDGAQAVQVRQAEGAIPAGGGLLRGGLQANAPDSSLEGSALENASPIIAQQLGLNPDELASLRDRLAGGQLSTGDLQQLCLRFAERQLTPDDVAGIAHSLGITLTADQLDQL